MRPRLVLGTVAAALTMPLIGFVVATASAAERPLPGADVSAAMIGVEQPTSAPAGDAASNPLATPLPTTQPSEVSSEKPSFVPSTPALAAEAPRAKPSVNATTRPVERPTNRPSQVTRQGDSPTGGWKVPRLEVGAIDIAAPVLASGRTARALVACAPSTACTVSGETLVISEAATSVSVTWSVPGSREYRAWSAQTSL
jgi:hypothetical protein